MSSLLSHFLGNKVSYSNEDNRNVAAPVEAFFHEVVRRFRYARASNLYDNSVGLTRFQDNILGKRLDRQLEKNFKLLATPNNIRQWRLAHESDILPDEVSRKSVLPSLPRPYAR